MVPLIHRILLVDPETVVAETLGPSLEKTMPLEVVPVRTAEEALQRLRAETFDAVLSEYRLPGMDGLELLRILRRDHPTVRRVMLTAHRESAVREQAEREAGVDAFVTKPYSLKGLERTLRAVLVERRPSEPEGRLA